LTTFGSEFTNLERVHVHDYKLYELEVVSKHNYIIVHLKDSCADLISLSQKL